MSILTSPQGLLFDVTYMVGHLVILLATSWIIGLAFRFFSKAITCLLALGGLFSTFHHAFHYHAANPKSYEELIFTLGLALAVSHPQNFPSLRNVLRASRIWLSRFWQDFKTGLGKSRARASERLALHKLVMAERHRTTATQILVLTTIGLILAHMIAGIGIIITDWIWLNTRAMPLEPAGSSLFMFIGLGVCGLIVPFYTIASCCRWENTEPRKHAFLAWGLAMITTLISIAGSYYFLVRDIYRGTRPVEAAKQWLQIYFPSALLSILALLAIAAIITVLYRHIKNRQGERTPAA